MVDTEIQKDEMSLLVAITGKMTTIVSACLQELTIAPTDMGVAALIIKYAEQIDKGNLSTLARLGPLLLQSMESLQMSPKSRLASAKAVNNASNKPTNKLDELRIKREERKNGTKDLHSATS